MQAPLKPLLAAASQSERRAITQPAWLCANCIVYLVELKKEMSLEIALSSDMIRLICTLILSGDPCNWPPRLCAMAIKATLALRIQRFNHFIRDVMLRIDVDRLLQNQIVFFSFSDLLDNAVSTLQYGLQLFVFACI